ncbi:MAG TPA: hypothetical protein PKG77_23305 [Phycisphaerae bacterium]|nr:hypothetical protein [Phycisphaerae bacterium]HQL76143.1 hypothetical protein [Phycisphaerae bacterium]
MNWFTYREHQGNWRDEVVLLFDPADKDDPFLKFRCEQYRKTGKTVRLVALRPPASRNPQS